LAVPLVSFTEAGEAVSLLRRIERRNEFSGMRSGNSVTYAAPPFAETQMMDVPPNGSSVVIVTRDAAESV
jgi:hypothetical protein